MYNSAERETIGLCICLEAIGDIANHALLLFREVTSFPGEAEVLFHSSSHRDLFLIRLLDFVKEGVDKNLTGVSGSCLEVLRAACSTKHFSGGESVVALKEAVEALESWLNHKNDITLWLPTLSTNAKISVSRLEFLKISGNQSKHNLSRLTGVSRGVAKILTENGYSVSEEQIPLVLDDFREHLSENYFIYYGTWLSELVNNIRWALQTYLMPAFAHAYKTEDYDSRIYRYEYPSDIQSEVPKQWFWRLMNNVRTGPYLKKFTGAHYLKQESSLEWDE
jgi:hypothetical protein